MHSIDKVIAEIASFQRVDDNWLGLDELVTELWRKYDPSVGIDALFKVFENYPTDDGGGVFWTILHGLETLEYEEKLVDSLVRKPSLMAITMLVRIENTGNDHIAGKSISQLRKMIKNHPGTHPELLSEI